MTTTRIAETFTMRLDNRILMGAPLLACLLGGASLGAPIKREVGGDPVKGQKPFTITFIACPAVKDFVAGDPRSKEARDAKRDLPGFLIAEGPVTLKQYEAALGKVAYEKMLTKLLATYDSSVRMDAERDAATDPAMPAHAVSPREATEFCEEVSARMKAGAAGDPLSRLEAARVILPSYAQWQRAALGIHAMDAPPIHFAVPMGKLPNGEEQDRLLQKKEGVYVASAREAIQHLQPFYGWRKLENDEFEQVKPSDWKPNTLGLKGMFGGMSEWVIWDGPSESKPGTFFLSGHSASVSLGKKRELLTVWGGPEMTSSGKPAGFEPSDKLAEENQAAFRVVLELRLVSDWPGVLSDLAAEGALKTIKPADVGARVRATAPEREKEAVALAEFLTRRDDPAKQKAAIDTLFGSDKATAATLARPRTRK